MQGAFTVTSAPDVLWRPDAAVVERSQMVAFRRWLTTSRDIRFSGYDALWRWSVDEPEAFWGAIAQFFDVAFHSRPTVVLAERVMPGAEWFPGATLNYAEHALRPGDGKADDDLAVVFRREEGLSDGLLVPLTVGGSSVLVRHEKAAGRKARMAAERVTAVAG